MARVFPNFIQCYQECHKCTGYKVEVTAVCCRSPLKDAYLAAVTKNPQNYNAPKFDFKERPRLDFKSKSVFYISSGGVNTIAPGETRLVPDDLAYAAVNLTRVWGGNGFYSRDLKDYLHLPAKTKLILMTITLDDLLERAWSKEFYADPLAFSRVGLDAWMPLSFSSYLESSHMHQYYQALRTHRCIDESHAWFATGDHSFPGLNINDIVLDAVSKIPQLIITPHGSYNMEKSVYDQTLTPHPCGTHLPAIKRLHALVPPHVAFWLVGPGAAEPSFMATVRRICGSRDLYWVSPKPFYLAAKGKALTAAGKVAASALPKLELVTYNNKMHDQLVRNYG